MNARTPIRASLLFTLAAVSAAAQTADPAIAPAATPRLARRHTPRAPSAPAGPNLNLVLLDPAHGGADPGGRLGANLLEKDVDLAFAQRLRTALAARGFTVVLTRENDPAQAAPTPNPDPTLPPIPAPQPAPITADTRAELANRNHPLACLLLHATTAGRGIHLYTSALAPVSLPSPSQPADMQPIQLWNTAQASFLPESQKLAADLSQSVRNLGLPLITGTSSVSPIDSMACAAVTVELAPAAPNGGSVTSPADPGYQARLANSIAEALTLWRSEAGAQVSAQTAAAAAAQQKAAEQTPVPAQKPRRKPKPATPVPAVSTGPNGAAQ